MTSAPTTTPIDLTTPGTVPVAPVFLDPQALLDASAGQRFVPPAWPVLFVAIGLVFASASLAGPNAGPETAVIIVGLLAVWTTHYAVRRAVGRGIAAEIQAVNALEELVLLRRWPEAADLVQRILSRPMYLRERRLTSLKALASILNRYHRFADARIVMDYLLSDESGFDADASTAHSIRVSRGIGMLREDFLVDADKAMSDLRREVNRARDEMRRLRGPEAAGEIQSAGLALLELYRDVKTGHYQEACDGFEKSMPIMRDQLGMRIADAWVLVAAARHALGRIDAAQTAYTNATALSPPVELHRRYPETIGLVEKYAATQSPAKAGAA